MKESRFSRKFKFFTGYGEHVAFVQKSGFAMVCGKNDFGQLSLGDRKTRLVPVKCPRLHLKEAGLGKSHSVFLLTSGTVVTAGSNSNGQLGIGETGLNIKKSIASKVVGVTERIEHVYAGEYTTFALARSGCVYSCGDNEFCALGFESITPNVSKMTLIPNLKNIKNVIIGGYAGEGHWSIFLSHKGRVFGVGCNEYHTLTSELGEDDRVKTPTEIMFFKRLQVDVEYIGASAYAAFFFTRKTRGPEKSGNTTSCCYVVGNNSCGEFGDRQTRRTTAKSPVVTSALHNIERFFFGAPDSFVMFMKDGKVYGHGHSGDYRVFEAEDSHSYYSPTLVKGLKDKDIQQICVSKHTSYAISSSGDVYGCGRNDCGQFMNSSIETASRKFVLLGNFDIKPESPKQWALFDKKERIEFLSARYSILCHAGILPSLI